MASSVSFSPSTVAEARAEVEQQRRLRSASPAQVVELRAGVAPSDELNRIGPATRCVVADTVLWHPAWTPTALAALAEALEPAADPARWLVFLEPVADLGWRLAAANRLASRDLVRHGHTFTADVPQALRDAGLTVTTTVRFDVGRRRTYAWGEARHFEGLPTHG